MSDNWNESNRSRSGRFSQDDDRSSERGNERGFDRGQDYRMGYGGSSHPERYFDANRNRSENDSWSRDSARDNRGARDWGQSSDRDWSRISQSRDSRDMRDSQQTGFNTGLPGFRSGADYGSYGRDSGIDSFRRGEDMVYGSSTTGRSNGDTRTYGSDFGYSNTSNRHTEVHNVGGTNRDQMLSSAAYGSHQYGSNQYGSNLNNSGQYGANNYGSQYGQTYGIGSEASQQQRGQHSGRGPKGYRRSDERIREEVCETLERHPHIDASEIEVDVKEGNVTLRGTVEDRRQKRMAEDVIENCSGVRDVRNELSVAHGSLLDKAKDIIMGNSDTAAAQEAKPQRSKH